MREVPRIYLWLMAVTAAASFVGGQASGAEEKLPMVREIFVPEADLNALLEGGPQRVLLPRDEYERLLELAKQAPEHHAPRKAVVLAADYEATIEQGRARISGTLELEVLEEGLWAVPLQFSGVRLRRASMDEGAARLARSGNDALTLFVDGIGRHRLVVEMVASVATTAARQRLSVRLPEAPVSRFRLTVPGDVEIKEGANVARRDVDSAAEVTRFELPVASGTLDLNLSLNSRLQRRGRVVVSRSVVVDEITEAYERLHATVSLAVLHRAVERFEFAVPDGFEVTDVATPQLARWAVAEREGRQILDVRLREPATGTVLLTLSAMRTGADLESWRLPRLVPLDVVAESTVVGLLLDQRLIAEEMAADGLIPIDTTVLEKALPATVFEAAPGAPPIRPISAWYAPQDKFSVSARFRKPPAKVTATSNLLLVLENRRQRIRGGYFLVPEAEPLFEFEFDVPPLWHVTTVTDGDGEPIEFERYGAVSEAGYVRVRLKAGIEPGEGYRVYFEAEAVPPDWLGEWKTRTVEFPRFTLRSQGREVGAIAVDAQDDMVAQPDPAGIQRLAILGKEDREKHLAGLEIDLAYRIEGSDYRLPLTVARVAPRLTAKTFSFLRIEPDALIAHYELIYNVEEAKTPQLSLSLPASTPEAVSIRGLDGVLLKGFVSSPGEDRRRWDVHLAEPRAGHVRLAVDFQQPISIENQGDVALPVVRAEEVAWQSGHVAVEGNAELEIAVDTDRRARRVDVGELVDAEYQPGRRLLGVFGFVDTPGTVSVDVIRREGHALFPAIVPEATLESRLSASGVCQTEARFLLHTKVPSIEVALPPLAELWSGTVDARPFKPQKDGDRWLVHLPAADRNRPVELQLVYEMPVSTSRFRGHVDMKAPELRFRAEGEAVGMQLPIVKLTWKLYPPSGYTVLDCSGTVMLEPKPRKPAIWTLARTSVGLLFGSPWWLAARDAAAPTASARRLSAGEASQSLLQYERALSDASDADAGAVDFEMYSDRAPAEPTLPDAPLPGMQTPADEDAAVAQPPAENKPAAESVDALPAPQRHEFRSASALKIDLDEGPAPTQHAVTFTSLGSSPRLVATLVDRSRVSTLGVAIGLIVLLTGVMLTTRRARTKACYLLVVVALGSLIPLLESVLPFRSGLNVTLEPGNVTVYAAAWLVPYYLVAGFLRWLLHVGRSLTARHAATAGLILAGLVHVPAPAQAEPPASAPYVVEIVDPMPPVTIPADAVVIPYDATTVEGIDAANRILVPYDKYVDLRNRAYPGARPAEPPPADYSLAGVQYRVALLDREDLLLDGEMTFEVFVKEPVAIPLGLSNGVFTQAELDGQAARLSAVEIAPAAANEGPQPSQQAKPQKEETQENAEPIVLLHVDGKWRHRLKFQVRMRLQRRGGWRAVQGRVPAAPVAAIDLEVPQAQTEVLLIQDRDRLSRETEKAGARIESALGPDGVLNLQWRPRVAEGVVDRSLTAQSTALVDIQEDGVRVSWDLQLEFRQSQHERFSLQVPEGYLVERVEGTNVRGWETSEAPLENKLTVTLLKAAEGREQFAIRLWRAKAITGETATAIASPVVHVDGAALHKGLMTIRRSPMLDLRIEEVSGATRTDIPAEPAGEALDAEQSPLGIRPFQAYQFASTDFAIQIVAKPVRARLSAEMRSIVRISEYERGLECQVHLTAENRPVYRVEVLLPESYDLEEISAPGEFEWSIVDSGSRPKLSVMLASGQQGTVPILFSGRLASDEDRLTVPLPNVQVLEATEVRRQMAVQADPVYDVSVPDLSGGHPLLLNQVAHWLTAEQRQVTALALALTDANYEGTLQLALRQPDVSCDTITNVRVTDRALEETILLDYRIEHAGIREVNFVIPRWMEDSRIRVPMLRQKELAPVSDEADSPIRVRLELQDEVMGQLRVLVENDRMLQTGVDLLAAIPEVAKGDRFDAFSVRQFVTLEKAGLDDIEWNEEASTGIERLGRGQVLWNHLRGVLGEGITEAFLVVGDDPRLSFRARRFEARQTTDARIGMSETRFMLDAAGAYRAEQLFWIDNGTEQYLEIEMPRRAQLWTAQLWSYAAWTARRMGGTVLGEPVKPTQAPSTAGPGRIRIPIVKTAEGDNDYVIRLQYGGTIEALDAYTRFDLPFIRPIGVKVDQSQVRLYLPETHWFEFDDTMTRVEDEGDLAAEQQAYLTRGYEKLNEVLSKGNPFAQARALNSLVTLDDTQSTIADYAANESFQAEKRRNVKALEETREAAVKVQQSLQGRAELANRDRLRHQVEQQSNAFARNVVSNLGSNFKQDAGDFSGQTTTSEAKDGRFDSRWLDKNQLANDGLTVAGEKAKESLNSRQRGKGVARGVEGRLPVAGREAAGKAIAGPGLLKRPARGGAEMGKPSAKPKPQPQPKTESEQQRRAVTRYQTRHMQQQQAIGQAGAQRMGDMGGSYGDGYGGGGFFEAEPTTPLLGQANSLAASGSANLAQNGSGVVPATGLASLDLEFDFKGREYLFTTPQGDVQISGHAVSAETARGVGQLLGVLLLLALAAYVVRQAVRGRFEWWRSKTGSTCLLAAGLLAILCLPVVGILATVGAVMIKVNHYLANRVTEAAS